MENVSSSSDSAEAVKKQINLDFEAELQRIFNNPYNNLRNKNKNKDDSLYKTYGFNQSYDPKSADILFL